MQYLLNQGRLNKDIHNKTNETCKIKHISKFWISDAGHVHISKILKPQPPPPVNNNRYDNMSYFCTAASLVIDNEN